MFPMGMYERERARAEGSRLACFFYAKRAEDNPDSRMKSSSQTFSPGHIGFLVPPTSYRIRLNHSKFDGSTPLLTKSHPCLPIWRRRYVTRWRV